jgi:hypothetical protein
VGSDADGGWIQEPGRREVMASLTVICSHGVLGGRRAAHTIASAIRHADGRVMWDYRCLRQHERRMTLRLHCVVCAYDIPLNADHADALWQRATGDTPGEHSFDMRRLG